MTVSDASLVVAGIGTIATIIWFLIIAHIYPSRTDFFFANRSLDAIHIRANLAATATSLAGALFFFLNSTPAFGWLMLLVPIFNVLGIALFLLLVKDEEPNPKRTGSIYRFIHYRTGSIQIARYSNYVVIFNFVTIFIIEIVIGSRIFAYFFEGEFLVVFLSAVFLCAVVLWYVTKGGFIAVSNTDRWQFNLVSLGLLLTFLSLGFYWVGEGFVLGFVLLLVFLMCVVVLWRITKDRIETFKILSVKYRWHVNVMSIVFLVILIFIGIDWLQTKSDFVALWQVFETPNLEPAFQWSFFVNIVFINLLLPSTQISTWERYSAGSREEVIPGFISGIWSRILPIWFIAIAISAILSLLTGEDTDFIALFDFLREGSIIIALLVFPLLFIGLVAALLSTADSMLIAIMLAVQDAKNSSDDEDFVKDEEPVAPPKKAVFITGLIVIAITLIVEALVSLSTDINKTVVQLLFAGYGMPCLLFPLIAFSCLDRNHRLIDGWAVSALFVGLLVLWGGSIYGMISGDFRATLLSPVLGILCVGAGVGIGRHPLTRA